MRLYYGEIVAFETAVVVMVFIINFWTFIVRHKRLFTGADDLSRRRESFFDSDWHVTRRDIFPLRRGRAIFLARPHIGKMVHTLYSLQMT